MDSYIQQLPTTYTFDDLQIVPQYSEVESRSDCSLATRLTKTINIRLPYISAPMDTVTELDMACEMAVFGGIGAVHRFMSIQDAVDIVLSFNEFNPMDHIISSIGVTGDFKERATELVNAGCKVLLIDVAHGNTLQMKKALEWCKETLDSSVQVIAGNVATAEGARNLSLWGADAIRCGIGGGSVCSTRIKTGIGVPQASAIVECLRGIEQSNIDVPLIADGGIRIPADAAKALALGADTVMLGSLLAGTSETPHEVEMVGDWPNEQGFKRYRGSASAETKRVHGMDNSNVEGSSKLIPFKGDTSRIISGLNEGIQSSMSYVGAKTLAEFRFRAEFVTVTQNGVIEAKPHLLLA